jgi:hypothetical protein
LVLGGTHADHPPGSRESLQKAEPLGFAFHCDEFRLASFPEADLPGIVEAPKQRPSHLSSQKLNHQVGATAQVFLFPVRLPSVGCAP